MKKIKTSDITPSIGMPIKSGTLQHLQSAYEECLVHLAKSVIGPLNPTKVYVLWGCENTGLDPDYAISAGAIYYNGEIYSVPAANFTPSVGQVAVAILTTTYYTGINADPVQFTDGVSYNVHEIRTITFVPGAPGAGLCDFNNLARNKWQTIDISGLITITTGAATITDAYLKYKRVGDVLFVNFNIAGSVTPSSSKFYFNIALPNIIKAFLINPFERVNAAVAYEVLGTINQATAYIVYGAGNTLQIKAAGSAIGTFTLGGQLTYQAEP